MLRYILAIIAGAILPLAFAPLSITNFAIISPALLLLTINKQPSKKTLLLGWLFGFSSFAVGVSWVYVSMLTYGDIFAPFVIPFAVPLTLVFVGLLAFIPAIKCYLLNKFFPQNNVIRFVIAFPTIWVVIDWIQGWLFGGFPWLYLGYSQVDSALRGFAPIMGVHGISLLLLIISGLLVHLGSRIQDSGFKRQNHCPLTLKGTDNRESGHPVTQIIIARNWNNFLTIIYVTVSITIIWFAGYYLTSLQWTHPSGNKQTVSVIQPNMPLGEKWRPGAVEELLDRYAILTAQHQDSDIIVWPEAALPIEYSYIKDYLENIAEPLAASNTSLIVGVHRYANKQLQFYNSMLALGAGSGDYNKKHLVVFGEYTPFAERLPKVVDFLNITPSPMLAGDIQQPTFSAGGITLIPFICYDVAYTDVLRSRLAEGEVLIAVNDLSWFGASWAAPQFLEQARMRALESQRYFIFSTNDGISAIINPDGSIQAQAPDKAIYVLQGEVIPRQGLTPWVYLGSNLLILILLSTLLIVYFLSKRISAD